MNGQGGVMRLYATITAVLAAVTVIGLSGANAFAETTTTNINNNAVSTTTTATKSVTVQQGNNLSVIAASNNTTYVRIFDANGQIVDPDLIYPGESLMIPSAAEQLPDRPLPSGSVTQVTTATTTNSNVDQSTDNNQAVAQTPIATTQAAVNSPEVVSPVSTQQPSAVPSGSVWDNIAQCESGGDWSIDTGNGFYGGLQFTLSSWESVGGTGYPNQASRSEQIMRAQLLQQQQGWGAWPVCSAKLGL